MRKKIEQQVYELMKTGKSYTITELTKRIRGARYMEVAEAVKAMTGPPWNRSLQKIGGEEFNLWVLGEN